MDLAELRDRCQQSLEEWRGYFGHTEAENCQAPISVVEALELIDELKKLRELCGEAARYVKHNEFPYREALGDELEDAGKEGDAE